MSEGGRKRIREGTSLRRKKMTIYLIKTKMVGRGEGVAKVEERIFGSQEAPVALCYHRPRSVFVIFIL
jgi:hypothetical protein